MYKAPSLSSHPSSFLLKLYLGYFSIEKNAVKLQKSNNNHPAMYIHFTLPLLDILPRLIVSLSTFLSRYCSLAGSYPEAAEIYSSEEPYHVEIYSGEVGRTSIRG